MIWTDNKPLSATTWSCRKRCLYTKRIEMNLCRFGTRCERKQKWRIKRTKTAGWISAPSSEKHSLLHPEAVCKHFVTNTKKRKSPKPCRGFKSFVLLSFVMKFWKKCVFGSSNPSTRKNIENGSMEIRKKLGSKKTEKSLEISVFLVFSRSDRFWPLDMAHYYKIDPYHKFFRNRSVLLSQRIDLSLGDDGSCT